MSGEVFPTAGGAAACSSSRGLRVVSGFLVGLATVLISRASLAQLEVGADGRSLIVARFPKEQQERYPLFTVRCGKCHSLQRPVLALADGKTPVTKLPFEDENIREYVIKMMRKRGSRITKPEAVELIAFMRFARSEAKKGVVRPDPPVKTDHPPPPARPTQGPIAPQTE